MSCKKVLAAALAVAGGLCFLVMPATSNFIWLILVLTLYNAFLLPVMPGCFSRVKQGKNVILAKS